MTVGMTDWNKYCWQNVVSKEVYIKILFSDHDIVPDFINSDIFRFFGDNMGILSIDLNNISLDDVNFHEDDPETIIHVRLMAWCNRFKHIKYLKNS